MSRLLGVLYFIDQSVNTYHMVPDINDIDLQVSNTYVDIYRSILNKSEHDKDKEDVTVPKLNSTSNWRDFKDTLILKLSTNKGTRDVLLE